MNTYRFKTTLKCGGCVAKLTPWMDELIPHGDWEVDLNSPDKIVTVTTGLPAEKVIETIESAGFKAQLL